MKEELPNALFVFLAFPLPLLGLIKILGGLSAVTVFQFPILPFKSISPRAPCVLSAITSVPGCQSSNHTRYSETFNLIQKCSYIFVVHPEKNNKKLSVIG